MKRLILATIIAACQISIYAQDPVLLNTLGESKIVSFDINQLPVAADNNSRLAISTEILFPGPKGELIPLVFTETFISGSRIESIQTFSGVSDDGKVKARVSLSSEGRMSGIMHSPSGYYFIEPNGTLSDKFIVYPRSSSLLTEFECGTLEEETNNIIDQKYMRMSSISPFPIGQKLRKFRMAAAATGEFVQHYGSKTNALNKIVEMFNVINLIYELEAAITFELISATTSSKTILFDNPATDPFTPASRANAYESQNGFNLMHTQGLLDYSAYDIGHTFHIFQHPSYSTRGQATTGPCYDYLKAGAWTEWSSGTDLSYWIGSVSGIAIHEIGHQFNAGHSYSAGGGSPANPQFCFIGASLNSAVEPGSGSTIMAYGTNCTVPDYRLLGVRSLDDITYFHTHSLDQILYAVENSFTCKTEVSTGKFSPVADAGPNITIPKATPFMLRGKVSSGFTEQLYYSWDQVDLAVYNDIGALGKTMLGLGGYPAVNSTTAPLFRSNKSESPERSFPSLEYVLNDSNVPSPNAGEHLPEVARTMNFRFTVRDYQGIPGRIDSDDLKITVANVGPLKVTSFNTTQTLNAGNNYTLNWAVNNTNTLAPKVTILMSIDGGESFPYVLANSVNNNGSRNITIPSKTPHTTQARFKILHKINDYAEFFDINDADITINSSCTAVYNIICSDSPVSAQAGSGILNLSLSSSAGKILEDKQGSFEYFWEFQIEKYAFSGNGVCRKSSFTGHATKTAIKVTKSGYYQIENNFGLNGGYTSIAVFDSPAINCSSFIGSNIVYAGGNFETKDPKLELYLDECTTYHIIIYVAHPYDYINLVFDGPGEIIEHIDLPSGYSYTYVAVDHADEKIKAASTSTDFTVLSQGDYSVYGLLHESSLKHSQMINKSKAQLLSLNYCMQLSSNEKKLHLEESPCPPNQTLSGNAVSGKVQVSNSIQSSQVVNSGRNVTYQAAQSILLTPQSGSGFSVGAGAFFKAEIKNCD